ncbi:MAG TPA: YMGG-like glycine zipper-containing protein [Rhodocyclaceae bacterium]|nr:YMGG-like glycine zipper-containing protein [Rhodocyclaceae bacterium]
MKKIFLASLLVAASLGATNARADEFGGALVGGGVGAVVGHAVAGRNGALVGGVVGAVTGASIASQPRYYAAPPAYGYAPQQVAYYAPPPAPVYYVRPAPPPVVYYAPAGYGYGYGYGGWHHHHEYRRW